MLINKDLMIIDKTDLTEVFNMEKDFRKSESDRGKDYYIRNKEKILEKRKQYYLKNREKLLEQKKKYNQFCKEN